MPTAEQRFVSFPNKYGPYENRRLKVACKLAPTVVIVLRSRLVDVLHVLDVVLHPRAILAAHVLLHGIYERGRSEGVHIVHDAEGICQLSERYVVCRTAYVAVSHHSDRGDVDIAALGSGAVFQALEVWQAELLRLLLVPVEVALGGGIREREIIALVKSPYLTCS